MEQKQRTERLTRRAALALAAAAGMAPFSGFAAETAAPMMTRPIPRTTERLPVIGLGTYTKFAGSTPGAHEQLRAVVQTLVDGGGSVVDTSSNYGNEEQLGWLFADGGLRRRVFLSTKLEPNDLGRDGIQGSLRRLGASKIDLILVHTATYALESQSLAPLREWKAQGLVRYIGISTANKRFFPAIEAVMRRERPDFVEINYCIGDQEAEQRILPTAYELGIATLIDQPFGGVFDQRHNLFRYALTKPLPDWAHEFDAASWARYFLKFVLAHPAVTVAIPGTSNPSHMADNLAAGRGRLPDPAMRQRMVQYVQSPA
jgi:diketogulonate reductase-like aldo/keto reductase